MYVHSHCAAITTIILIHDKRGGMAFTSGLTQHSRRGLREHQLVSEELYVVALLCKIDIFMLTFLKTFVTLEKYYKQ